jgi:hypothetical protein
VRVVNVAGEIVMIPGRSLDEQLRRMVVDRARVAADITAIQADLNSRQAVSVTVEQPRASRRGDASLLVHGSTYVMRLYLRDRGDAYTIASVTPLRLRDHDRLARGCLLLTRVRWRMAYTPMEIPAGSHSHWQILLAEWGRLADGLAEAASAPALTAAHERFLDTMSRVIDETERITKETERAQVFPYRKMTATGEVRHGLQSVYEFHVVGPGQPEQGAFVEVRGVPAQRGRVTRVAESVTVKFDQPIDFDRFPRQGHLEVRPSGVVHQTRRAAVNLLRERQARNTGLLRVLVDNQLQPLTSRTAEPTERLDDDQLAAFRKALVVPDMLGVLGPPGTGKTRTISQIVHANVTTPATGEDYRRVLVTAHTNRAVDNILPRLPADLLVVRIGNEDSVTEDGKPYLLELRAADLRQEILNATEPTKNAYGNHRHAAQWLTELDRRLTAMATTLIRESQSHGALAAARRTAGGSAQVAVDALAATVDIRETKLRRTEAKIVRWNQRRGKAAARGDRRLSGGYHRFLVRRADRRLAARQAEHLRLTQDHERLREELRQARSQLDAATRHVPEVRAAASEVHSATRGRVEACGAAREAEAACRMAVTPMEIPPPVRIDAEPPALHADLAHFSSWLHTRLPVFAARARLLQEWHSEVSGETRQLYPELIRYADVVAATAIGSGSRPELSDVEFDLAVVDEAGQIAMPDILVPLVRVRRGVVVGDHRQLPPFLDDEVKKWGVADGDPAVEALLTKSALELMVERFPLGNVVPLTLQRRMPAVIADFISSAFYEHQLHTDVVRPHRDQLFARQFVFVDTSSLPALTRHETGADVEAFGRRGFVNEAEAELLVRLAVHYHRLRAEWAVIVPYKAQVDLIQSRLSGIAGSSALVALNVGTVDSFQGGERDVILYGFTRSNPERRVGFLDELRRANVAFTRAKQQLVLVGDLPMLADATNPRFRALIRDLRDYLGEHGDIRRYQDIRDRLDDSDRGHEAWEN